MNPRANEPSIERPCGSIMDKPETHSGTSQQLLTKAQVALYVQCTPRCIDNWMRRGYLPYLKIGRAVRFRITDLEAYLEENFRVIRRHRTSAKDFLRSKGSRGLQP